MNRRGKTKEGFLHVKQPSRFGKAWKRKWVVIRTNTTKGSSQSSVLLELYMEKGAYNKQVTSLLLEGITHIRRVISKSQSRAFEFLKGGGTVALTLSGDSETDTQEWMDVFRKLLLPASEQKEVTSVLGFGSEFFRVSVIPNKDSERLKLSGVYLAGVSRLTVALHHPLTGEKALEWDLRHLKRFMLPSKGPQQDLEKIACLQISNRSPQGEGEYLFYSPSAKPFVETIYERLSAAITVKERRSRSSSMLFEIPPKELEQLAKAIQEGGDPGFVMVGSDGSMEDTVFHEEEEDNVQVKSNGDASNDKTAKENHVSEVAPDKTNGENGDAAEIKPSGDVAAEENHVTANVEKAGEQKKEPLSNGGDPSPTKNAEEQSAGPEGGKTDNSDQSSTPADAEPHNSETNGKADEHEVVEANEQSATAEQVANEAETNGSCEKHDAATGAIDREEEEEAAAGDVTPHVSQEAAEIHLENDASKCEEESGSNDRIEITDITEAKTASPDNDGDTQDRVTSDDKTELSPEADSISAEKNEAAEHNDSPGESEIATTGDQSQAEKAPPSSEMVEGAESPEAVQEQQLGDVTATAGETASEEQPATGDAQVETSFDQEPSAQSAAHVSGESLKVLQEEPAATNDNIAEPEPDTASPVTPPPESSAAKEDPASPPAEENAASDVRTDEFPAESRNETEEDTAL